MSSMIATGFPRRIGNVLEARTVSSEGWESPKPAADGSQGSPAQQPRENRQSGRLTPRSTGITVPASYFRHIPDGICKDDRFVLQRRDIDGDGILDEVGYPFETTDAHVRPFTLSGEGDDFFTYGSGQGRLAFQDGAGVVCEEKREVGHDKYAHSCEDDLYTSDHSAPLSVEGTDSLSIDEGYGSKAIWRVIGYAEIMMKTFVNDLSPRERFNMAKLAVKYLKRPSEQDARNALAILNNRMPPVTVKDGEEFPRLTEERLDLLAELAHDNAGVLDLGVRNCLGRGPHDLAMELVGSNVSESLMTYLFGIVNEDNIGGRIFGGEYTTGQHAIDLDRRTIARVDALFGSLVLHVGVRAEGGGETVEVPVAGLVPRSKR